MALSIYHIDVNVDPADYTSKIGVCAATKTEAAQIATDRLEGDGCTDVKIGKIERVAAQGSWTPGSTIIY